MSHLRSCFILALSLFGLALPAGLAATDNAPPPAATKDNAPHFPLRGVIIGVFPEKTTLLVRNEKIPGLLDAGTMAFRVANKEVFKYAKKGQLVVATIIVREDDFWLTDVQLSKR